MKTYFYREFKNNKATTEVEIEMDLPFLLSSGVTIGLKHGNEFEVIFIENVCITWHKAGAAVRLESYNCKDEEDVEQVAKTFKKKMLDGASSFNG